MDEKFFTRSRLRKLFRSAGYKDIEVYLIDYCFPNFLPFGLIKSLHFIDKILSKLLGFVYIIRLKKI